MTRKPSLVAIIWGLAFIAMAGLAVLQELKVLTTMTVFGLLAPLGLIVLGARRGPHAAEPTRGGGSWIHRGVAVALRERCEESNVHRRPAWVIGRGRRWLRVGYA